MAGFPSNRVQLSNNTEFGKAKWSLSAPAIAILILNVSGLYWIRGEVLAAERDGVRVRCVSPILGLERTDELVLSFDRPLSSLEEIRLPWRESSFTLGFAALDTTDPAASRYSYLLEGFDTDWTESCGRSHATYTNLPPGDYTFRVRGSNNDGIWNDQGTSIRLHVEPPPWQTPWAYSLYSLFFGGTVVGYRRKQNKKLNQVSEQKQLLESEVEARTRELSERNDELKNLNQRLMQASVTDSLTGLKNRRFLDEFIDTEIARVDRRQHGVIARKSSAKTINISPSLFFMMIDLDGFKGINDAHGHLAGDRALVQVRDILHSSCRQSDTIIRWGGDEFMVIGNTASPHTVEQLAERIRANLAGHRFALGNGHVGRLSGSIGFAMYPFAPSSSRSLHWEQVVAVAAAAVAGVSVQGEV